jgi:hypothetical protein
MPKGGSTHKAAIQEDLAARLANWYAHSVVDGGAGAGALYGLEPAGEGARGDHRREDRLPRAERRRAHRLLGDEQLKAFADAPSDEILREDSEEAARP